jgi:hypothetical protein
VVEAIELLDLEPLYASYRVDGHGRAAHDMQMMLTPLAYAPTPTRRAPSPRGRSTSPTQRTQQNHPGRRDPIEGGDFEQLEPNVSAAERELSEAGVTERPEVVFADAGYWSNNPSTRSENGP